MKNQIFPKISNKNKIKFNIEHQMTGNYNFSSYTKCF